MQPGTWAGVLLSAAFAAAVGAGCIVLVSTCPIRKPLSEEFRYLLEYRLWKATRKVGEGGQLDTDVSLRGPVERGFLAVNDSLWYPFTTPWRLLRNIGLLKDSEAFSARDVNDPRFALLRHVSVDAYLHDYYLRVSR